MHPDGFFEVSMAKDLLTTLVLDAADKDEVYVIRRHDKKQAVLIGYDQWASMSTGWGKMTAEPTKPMLRRNHRRAVPSKVLYVRVPVWLHDRLSAEADESDRSLSAVVERLLIVALGPE